MQNGVCGGRGGVIQSAMGVAILSVLGSGMIFVGVTPYLQQAVQGALILFAVVGATLLTRCVRVLQPTPPSLSVRQTVTVKLPLSV